MVATQQEPKVVRKPSLEEVQIAKSPVKTYVFRNLENPGRDGQAGACLRCNFGPHFKVEADDGQLIELPTCVADWLNNLETPRYVVERDEASGQERHVKSPIGNKRFSLTEVQTPPSQAKSNTEESSHD